MPGLLFFFLFFDRFPAAFDTGLDFSRLLGEEI
jgi:hypothetical protein